MYETNNLDEAIAGINDDARYISKLMAIQEAIFDEDFPHYEHFDLDFPHTDVLINETTGEEYTHVHDQTYRFHVRSLGG